MGCNRTERVTQCIGRDFRPGVHGTRRVLEQTRRVQGNLLMDEDELDEFMNELGESDEDGPDGLNEGEPIEFSLDSTSRVRDGSG